MPVMQIFIPGALPPAVIAREIADQLPQRAPTLHGWMRRLPAQVEIVDHHETGCTPAELWELRRAGFQADTSLRLSAGLGPLRAGMCTNMPADKPTDEPVWLADLVHLSLGARRVTLTPLERFGGITETEDQALFDAVSPWLDGSGISLTRLFPGRWRVGLPADLALPSASPAVVSGGQLDDWWPQDAASRPWRRLLNDIQMIWHDHPVNLSRIAQGLPPVNSLWLYGGARPWSSSSTHSTNGPVLVRTDLAAPADAGDWSAWLTALAGLDRDALVPLAARHNLPCIVLAGDDRLVTLAPTRNLLPDWFPRRAQNWTSWWHPHV